MPTKSTSKDATPDGVAVANGEADRAELYQAPPVYDAFDEAEWRARAEAHEEQPTIIRPATRTGRSKIALVGYTRTRNEAPFNDPARPRDEWELWGMNDLWRYMPTEQTKAAFAGSDLIDQNAPVVTWDAWFDIHLPEHFESGDPAIAEAKVRWLTLAHPFPIYLPELLLVHIAGKLGAAPSEEDFWWKAVMPAVEVFPHEWIIGKLPAYYTNSVAWMAAFAILQMHAADGSAVAPGAELGVWGIDMAVATEYGRQRPSCEFYLGIAAGCGILVTLPTTTDLLKCAALYGIVDDPLGAKLRGRLAELQTQEEQLGARRNQLNFELGQLEGGLREIAGAKGQITYQLATYHHAVRTDRDASDDPLDHIRALTR